MDRRRRGDLGTDEALLCEPAATPPEPGGGAAGCPEQHTVGAAMALSLFLGRFHFAGRIPSDHRAVSLGRHSLAEGCSNRGSRDLLVGSFGLVVLAQSQKSSVTPGPLDSSPA